MRYHKYEECIDACIKSFKACEFCADTCLHDDNVEQLQKCIKLARSCSDLSILAVKEMIRCSPFADRICAMCADACKVCAEECEQHENDHCQYCAETCRRCMDLCEVMTT
jgi:hypothetical protein